MTDVGVDARVVVGDLLDRWIADVEARVLGGHDAAGRADPVLALSWPSRDVEMAYDDLTGAVRLRPESRAAMAPVIAAAVRRGAVLVAESTSAAAGPRGEVLGIVGIETPARSAPMTEDLAVAESSYLAVLHVREKYRGRWGSVVPSQAPWRPDPSPWSTRSSTRCRCRSGRGSDFVRS